MMMMMNSGCLQHVSSMMISSLWNCLGTPSKTMQPCECMPVSCMAFDWELQVTGEFHVTNAAQLGFSLGEHPFLCNAAQHAALHCLSAFSVKALQSDRTNQ